MNVDEVEKWVAKIREMAGDPEDAHSEEDDLFAAVLQAISEGLCADPSDAARAALESRSIDFPRWYG